MSKDVAISLASVAPPVDHIDPDAKLATLVIYMDGAYDGGKKAFTWVLDGTTFLGQVTQRSYFVAKIPPGDHVLVESVPELGSYAGCGGLIDHFDAGRVYILRSSDPVGLDVAKRPLSLYTRLEPDEAAGNASVAADLDRWRGCVSSVRTWEAKSREERSAAFLQRVPANTVALGSFDIPSPP